MSATDALEPIDFDDLQVGDEVMIHNAVGKVKGVIVQAGYGNNVVARIPIFNVDHTLYRETDQFELISRRPPLPDVPGTVGMATINGRRVRVMLVRNGSGTTIWVCASPATPSAIAGVYLVADEAIEDFVRLDVTRDGMPV